MHSNQPTKKQIKFLKEILPDYKIPEGITKEAVEDLIRYLGF